MQLSIQSINDIIDSCLSKLCFTEEKQEAQIRFRRGVNEDVDSINAFCLEHECLSSSLSIPRKKSNVHPSLFYILLEAKETGGDSFHMKGFAVWYIGYSTWKGKVMNLDTIYVTKSMPEDILMNALVKIAQSFAFSRIVYQVSVFKVCSFFVIQIVSFYN